MLNRTLDNLVTHTQETISSCKPLQEFMHTLAEKRRHRRNEKPVEPAPVWKPVPVSNPYNASSRKRPLVQDCPSPPPKKCRITIGKSMEMLVKKLAQEISEKMIPIPRNPHPVVSPQPLVPVPRHSNYHHQRITAVLSIGTHGFTLSNAAKSVTQEGGSYDILHEVNAMKVRLLFCVNEETFQKWKNLQENSNYKFTKLRVKTLKDFKRLDCIYCKNKECHQWNAAAGIAHKLKIPFNPIVHEKQLKLGYYSVCHPKVAAVLSVTPHGFTLCNGVESIFVNGPVSNSTLAEKVKFMNIRILNCFDERTYKKWMDIQTSYEKEFHNLIILQMKPIKMRPCHFCQEISCHQWNACVGMSFHYKLPFDPIQH